jgi:hypothetical protein
MPMEEGSSHRPASISKNCYLSIMAEKFRFSRFRDPEIKLTILGGHRNSRGEGAITPLSRKLNEKNHKREPLGFFQILWKIFLTSPSTALKDAFGQIYTGCPEINRPPIKQSILFEFLIGVKFI